MKLKWIFISILALVVGTSACSDDDDSITDGETTSENLPNITGYPIVGTNQTTAFNNTTNISTPSDGDYFYGQNANYQGNTPQYVDNGDGTVTDMVTGLMWQNTLDHNGDGDINYDDKLSYSDILALASEVTTGDYTDWRVPTIKEQYSLMMFSGRDISGYEGTSTEDLIPFINTDFFGYNYGDLDAGERLIDVQCASTNLSVGSDIEMVFGVNFADGRIKGYGTTMMGQDKVFNYLMVRGNTSYGENNFSDNSDGTITDAATELMWMQDDSGEGMNWQEALTYAENFEFAGKSDWRLPSAKELQSIVDYSRSPQTTSSAAIDPLFNCTPITNEAGEVDYPFYWTGTTHATLGDDNNGGWGAYVAFGRAMGNESMPAGPPAGDGINPPTGDGQGPPPADGNDSSSETINWTDVHGAGAQRSDPKSGDPSEFSEGHGPQGDAVRIYNFVRLVRNN
ncbi:DUF1566 domain-containing protein [Ancylomarina sp. 16SWW S1-10-2]|uniref:Lcl C-terminal domain-containing protein n=1 Tax=Ancylomarina sp. 16SWW S1-10-2 TaxID=2499681 RepID=UPI0012ADB7A8|nr:DUF1566 domain-containing protein [Ancylomarina sp. 16SWW S1-10-2]MRT93521.1 DUF1566 domain-containing protein [Ancylomarina sp. 16SWW S1-10-2]